MTGEPGCSDRDGAGLEHRRAEAEQQAEHRHGQQRRRAEQCRHAMAERLTKQNADHQKALFYWSTPSISACLMLSDA